MIELKRNLIHIMQNRTKLPNDAFVDLMSKIMANYSYIGWELGCSCIDSDHDVLSLTTNGDKELISQLIEELTLPISGDGWSIQAGNQPKLWDLFFEITTTDGSHYEIDASHWSWVASWNENFVDLIIFLDQQIKDTTIVDESLNIVLNGELGELNVIKYIKNISWKNNIAGRNLELKEMKSLKKEFVNNFQDCHFYDVLSK